MEKDLEYLFNNVSLYTKEEFEVFKLNDGKYTIDGDIFKKFKKYIGMKEERIITYCHKCKKEFPFNVDMNCVEFEKDIHYENCLYFTEGMSQSLPAHIHMDEGNIYGLQPPYDKEVLKNDKIWYIEYVFKCTNNHSHKYILMISIELKNGKFIVRKIGQNPSMLTIKGFDFDKYRNFLEKINAYEDYKKADLSNADHFYVGAYAYLRRIFEKLIAHYLKDTKLKDDHMDTKIDAVKENFDPRIKGVLKNLYGILSISIHELDEEQSKEYYRYLKAVIDMQLEYIKTEEDKDKQSKSLEGILNQISNIVKRK